MRQTPQRKRDMHDSQDGSFFGKINRLRPGSPLPSLLTALTRNARNPEQRCSVSLCSRGAGFFRAIHSIPSVMEVETAPTTARKSVVEGKRVTVRVDIGGRRLIKKKRWK